MSSTGIWLKSLLPALYFCCSAELHSQVNKLMLPNGHENGVGSVQFTKDGKKLISASFDQTIRIWDFASGSLLKTIYTGDPTLGTLALSPDERYVLVTSGRNTISVWDIATGREVTRLRGHSGSVYTATFSPDGLKILTGSTDNSAIIWSMPEGKFLFQLKGHTRNVDRVVFSPNGRLVSTSSFYDSTTRIWNAADGSLLFVLPGLAGSFSNDSKKLLTTYLESGYEWDMASGKKIHEYKEETNVNAISYNSSCTRLLIYTAYPRSCLVRNVQTGILETRLEMYSTDFMHPSFSPDDQFIVSYRSGNDIMLWNAKSGKQHSSFNILHNKSVYAVGFSNDSRYIASASADSSIIVRDVRSGKLIHTLETKVESVIDYRPGTYEQKIFVATRKKAYIWDLNLMQPMVELSANLKGIQDNFSIAEFSNDGKILYLVSSGNTINRYDLSSGKRISWKWILPPGEKPPGPGQRRLARIYGPTSISYDKSEILSTLEGIEDTIKYSFQPGRVMIWDLETGENLYQYLSKKGILCASQSNDKKMIVIGFRDSTLQIINRETGNVLATFDQRERIRSVTFNPDGNRIAVLSSNGVTIWSMHPQKYVDLIGYKAFVNSMEFSPDGSKIVTASIDQTARIWDATTGLHLLTIGDSTGAIKKAVFTPDGEKIITQTETNMFIAWDASDGRMLYRFYPGDQDNSIIQLPSGYYFSSPGYSKLLHYVTPEMKVLSFASLDIRYNRPDKVLEAIGNTDTALIRSYRRAWEKRIKNLGIDTTAFRDGYSVPEADFANREAINFEQKSGNLKLHIKGIDSTYKLDRFNVWVNESPIFGQRGITIRRKNSNRLDTTITIKLTQGENRIETSITNVNGTESYRMPLYVNYTPAIRQKESLHFIGIGIDQFSDSKHNLQYSTKDIRDLALKLKEKYNDNITIDTLFNEQVAIENVKALKKKLKQTTENDKVILAYSGHGLLSNDFDYYLSTYSINFDKPEENGLPYDELEALLDGIPARKKLFLIDACHSGEVDKDDLVQLEAGNKNDVKGLKPVAYKKEGQLGLKNSFELMQSLFVNVSKGTGATIISAAAGTQFALERGDLKNGVFTYSILETLDKHSIIKVSELRKKVSERVEQLTNGAQKPTSRSEPVTSDWEL